MDPLDLVDTLTQDFLTEVPDTISSVDEMEIAGQKLLRLAANYSYISSLLSYSKISVRQAKRNVQNEKDIELKEGYKRIHEDLVDKREIIENISEAIKQQYNAISRAVTIRIENNRELNMISR
jgi:hypothetical protein